MLYLFKNSTLLSFYNLRYRDIKNIYCMAFIFHIMIFSLDYFANKYIIEDNKYQQYKSITKKKKAYK